MASPKILLSTMPDHFSNTQTQLVMPAGEKMDSFQAKMIEMLKGLASQVRQNVFGQEFMTACDCAATPMTFKVHDSQMNFVFGVRLVSHKSAASRNAPYQINSYEIFTADKDKNYGKDAAHVIMRDQPRMLDGLKEELQIRLSDIMQDEYRANPQRKLVPASLPVM